MILKGEWKKKTMVILMGECTNNIVKGNVHGQIEKAGEEDDKKKS